MRFLQESFTVIPVVTVIVTRWTPTLPKQTAMKAKPSRWRVSGSPTTSVNSHKWYVRSRSVQSFMTSYRLACRDSRGMYHRMNIAEASAVKFSKAI